MVSPAGPRNTLPSIPSGGGAAKKRPAVLRGAPGPRQETLGVAARGAVVGSRAEHPAELGEALLALHSPHDRDGAGGFRVGLLDDGELPVGEGGDLRQMRDAQYLSLIHISEPTRPY